MRKAESFRPSWDSMAFAGALGWAIERFAYRPLRNRPRLATLITAIGVSFLLEFGFQLPSLRAQGRTFEELLRGWGWAVPGWLDAIVAHLPAHLPRGPRRDSSPSPSSGWTGRSWWRPRLQLRRGLLPGGRGLHARAAAARLPDPLRQGDAGGLLRAQDAGLMGIPVNRVISVTFVLGSCWPPRPACSWPVASAHRPDDGAHARA